MIDMEFKIKGAEAVRAKMESVTHEIAYKGGRFALRKAANLIADRARENALRFDDPDTASNISKNIAVRWSSKRFKSTGDLAFRVGVLGGGGGNLSKKKTSKAPGGDTRYWRLLEFGTQKMPAQPFMRPALERNQTEAAQEFIKYAEKAIERAAKRAGKGK